MLSDGIEIRLQNKSEQKERDHDGLQQRGESLGTPGRWKWGSCRACAPNWAAGRCSLRCFFLLLMAAARVACRSPLSQACQRTARRILLGKLLGAAHAARQRLSRLVSNS